MNVLVVGAGAIGMLFGSYIKLANSCSRVTYLTRGRVQADKIQQVGIEFHSNEGVVSILPCDAFPYEQESTIEIKNKESSVPIDLRDYNLVLVTVKQTQLDSVLDWMSTRVAVGTPLLFLMNGLGHVQKVRTALPNHYQVYFGITQSGATKKDLHIVAEKGRNMTKVGQSRELSLSNPVANGTGSVEVKEGHLHKWITHLAQAGIPISWTENIETEMWKKCLINACINPLTALFRVQNGMLLENAHLHILMRSLYDELACLISKSRTKDAEKILMMGRTWQEIEEVCRITSRNLSSMEQDIRYGRLTEIESMNGFFLEEAEKHHLSMPTHRFVYHSILYLQDQIVK